MSSSKKPKLGSTTFKKREDKRWFLIDAKGKTLGRMATAVKNILSGKHSVNYSENMDHGDGVIVINARKVHISGNKRNNKSYYSYSNYIGGNKSIPFAVLIDKNPERIITHAVKGMMRSGSLSRSQLTSLRIFADEHHDLTSQQPIVL